MKTSIAFLFFLGSLLSVRLSSAAVAAVTRVPITFTRNQVRIPISVNGSQPMVFVLDTGMPAPGILLNTNERTTALALKFSGQANVAGGGSTKAMAAQLAEHQRIAIGGIEIADVPVTMLPPGGFKETDGVIGLELFNRYAVCVDVDNKELLLFDTKTYQPPAGATIIPIRLVHDRMPFIDARVTVEGGEPVPVDVALDLGSVHALWLNERQPGKLAPPKGAIQTTLGRGVSGKIMGSVGRVKKIEMGGVSFDNLLAIFPDAAYQKPGGFDFQDGFIGADLLTRFVVTFDYASKRLVLVPGKRMGDPFEWDMTGMVFENANMDRRVIDTVLAGSPAEAAGIQPGDVLVGVNDKPLSAYDPQELFTMFRREGAEVRLKLERGGSSIEKPIKLRRLV
jgi:PDZ domain/Aspartyl protease